MTDPEPESSTKQASDSLLSRSPLNPAISRLKYATDDAKMSEENVFFRDDSGYKVAYAKIRLTYILMELLRQDHFYYFNLI